MGQKTNPNILRLGITKHWKTEFFEKKKKELPLYIFKDLEIQSYIERFLESKGVFIYDYSQFYSNNTLNLYISCFVSSKFRKSYGIILKNSKGDKKYIPKLTNKYAILNSKLEKFLNFTNLKKKINENLSIVKQMYIIKKYLQLNKYKIYTPNFTYNVFENCLVRMFKVILQFTAHKFDIIINFSCINKDFNYLKFFKKKKVNLLQRFKNVSFFKKDGLEILFHVVFNKNSARLLAKFLSFQLKTTKRPIFLLTSIKKTLKILMSSKLTTLKGIKIILKGRLRKGPRAKHKIITLGDIPVQSFDSNIDYFQTTTHNSNGSYGIKVWIVCK